MKCLLCSKKPVFNGYCRAHFTEYFEKKVLWTIRKYKLIKKKQRAAVAASGGKDSTTILYILKKYGYNVVALAINEGIDNYRDISLGLLANFCKSHGIKLKVVSFEQELKLSLDSMIKKIKERPCTLCGIFRRSLLNKFSEEYDVLVTGHNLDDEAQAVLMNLIKNNPESLLKQGPVSGIKKLKKYTKRVKPLYFLSEKEVMFYASINKLAIDFNCCPNVSRSFRLRLKKQLNSLESSYPDIKKNIILWLLDFKKRYKEKIRKNKKETLCKICGMVSSGKICSSCRYKQKINKLMIKKN